MEEEVTHKWRGDPLVRDFRTTREEKVKKNRLRKLPAEASEQSRWYLLDMLDRPVRANKP
jgi:ribosomal silencing factor RsfS